VIVEERTLAIRDGELAAEGSWVYAWQRPGSGEVLYVGATGLDPTVRCWLHLHDEDPQVGRVRSHRPEALTGAVTVRAFRLDPTVDRRAVKAAVRRLLETPRKRSGIDDDATAAAADAIVARLRTPTH
jgi:hypothetical protein